jgi:acyl-CoA reductase-like NAD-dependent aldehyde dehydrogenase
MQFYRKLKVGDSLDKETLIGPMISKEHRNKVQYYIDIARKEGAIVTTCELKLSDKNQNGYYVTPTIITNIDPNSVCMKDEIFGPVVCIVPFDSQEEVIEKANDTEYGLSATVWSASVDRIHNVAHRLKVGTVWCNCWLIRNLNMPFGGMKMSGIGREGTHDSREFYTQKKTVCLKINSK